MKHTYSFSPTPKKIAMALFFGIFFLLHSINLVAQVSSVTPTPNVLNENLTVNIVANFSTSMNQSTMNNNTVRVHGSLRGSIAGSISTQSNKLTFNPTANFEYNEVITVTLTAGIQTSGGSPITPYSWQFSTGVQPSTGFFTEKARPNVGTSPYGIAAGDYDNDGFFDLAVANTGSNNVSLLSFVNDSTYDPAVHTSVGDSPRGIISGDWDNDGDLDLATANFSSNNISILTNNGTGSFTVVNDTSNGEGTIALVAFDLDGDGDLDITAVNNVSLSIVVLFNDGNGDFTANTPANMANPPIAIAYGDIDGDKDLDVIVTTTLSVDLYLNNGPGSITYSAALPVETAPSFTGVANIDGDSDMDLVVISSAANYVTLFKNDGTGDFPDTLHSAVATGGVSVGFFDKDNDGDLDAGVVHSTQNYVTILQNGGSGNYTFSSLASVRNTPQSIVVLDYQRTGGIDIAVTNSGAHNVSVLKNVNTASNTAQISGKIFEDMNGNGVQDPEDTQGLQGWKIYMSGNVVDSTTTDNLGKYNFGSLPAGTYYITQVVEDEWYRTFPESNTDTISLASAANDTGHNFGNFRYGKISGIKFSDADGDGVKDNNETGLAGWTINLSGTATATATTNDTGFYEFTDLAAGEYTLSETRQGGWTRTLPADPGTYTLTVVSSSDYDETDFGNFGGKTKFRTFKADTSLNVSAKTRKAKKLAYKAGALVAQPNLGTAVENIFKKLGKVGATLLGVKQTDKDSAKKYAWVFANKSALLAGLYSSPADSPAYPFDSLRIPLKKSKKLAKAIKPARKSFNNIGIEQGIAFNLALIASRDTVGVTPKKFGLLLLDTAITFAGRQMEGQSLNSVGRYLDSAMTYYNALGINNASGYQDLRNFIGVLKEINNRFNVSMALSNYEVDSAGIAAGTGQPGGKKNPYAVTLKGEKVVSQVGIVRELPNAKSEVFFPYADNANVPEEFSLYQNYPNPFNPTTTLSFVIGNASLVTMKIYNVLGQEVATLLNKEEFEDGMHEIEFNAANLSSGVYFYRVTGTTLDEGNHFTSVKKMMLLK